MTIRICLLLSAFLGGVFNMSLLEAGERNFGEDVAFMSRHVETIVLGDDANGPRIMVAPAYQGRVMTSTARGDAGTSFGWINYDLISSGKTLPHMNGYGGEERFWLGPEGGQYAIFFKPGAKFEFEDWQTPALIDTDKYHVERKSENSVSMRHQAEVTNYSGTKFSLRIDREITLLSPEEIAKALGVDLPDVRVVGYQSTNEVTNTGSQDWTKDQGLLSIWLLCMYKHGPQTTVVIPFQKGPEAERGPIVNDTYFGKVPADRLKVGDGVLFFSGDGKYRSKIGLNPRRATPICGSYDAARGVLTVIKYDQPGPDVTDYVNSMWEIQKKPYGGDVVNSYNDGPPEPGAKPMGPFYEVETSSPALKLKKGQTGRHVMRTIHFEGPREKLDPLSRKLLGVSLDEIQAALR